VVLNNLAWALSELNDPKAIEYARHAYALAPESASVADTYGWVLVRSGDTAGGIEILRKAVQMAPADTAKRLRLAKALLKSGDTAQARKELEMISQPNAPLHARAEAEKMLKDF
jgi:Tfp pilus assembly protein PilF